MRWLFMGSIECTYSATMRFSANCRSSWFEVSWGWGWHDSRIDFREWAFLRKVVLLCDWLRNVIRVVENRMYECDTYCVLDRDCWKTAGTTAWTMRWCCEQWVVAGSASIVRWWSACHGDRREVCTWFSQGRDCHETSLINIHAKIEIGVWKY